jgi:hypothetical protein
MGTSQNKYIFNNTQSLEELKHSNEQAIANNGPKTLHKVMCNTLKREDAHL